MPCVSEYFLPPSTPTLTLPPGPRLTPEVESHKDGAPHQLALDAAPAAQGPCDRVQVRSSPAEEARASVNTGMVKSNSTFAPAAAMGGSRDAVDVQEVDDPEQDQFEDAVDSSGSGTDAIGCAFRDMAEAARSWTLDGALRDNAEIERSQVNALRSWCQESEILPDIAEPLLVAFLHCSRGDLEQAKAVVRVYESVRSKTPEVFADRSFHSEEVQRAKGVGYFCVLPNKTPEGYRVIVQALRDPDPAVFVYSSSSKAQFLTMDAVVRAEPTAPGYVCVFDMNAVQMSHMWAWGIRLPRKVFRYLQEGLPLRMQRIHFLNTTPLMDRVMRMLRPFIRKELQSIFQFHTADDMENLYKMIPQDCLPENYGGFLPPLEKLQDYTDKFLAEMNNMIPT